MRKALGREVLGHGALRRDRAAAQAQWPNDPSGMTLGAEGGTASLSTSNSAAAQCSGHKRNEGDKGTQGTQFGEISDQTQHRESLPPYPLCTLYILFMFYFQAGFLLVPRP